MSFLPLIPGGIGAALGSGSAFGWAVHEILRRIGGYVDIVPKLPEPQARTPVGEAAKQLGKSSVSRWKRLASAIGRQITDTFLDLIGETVKDTVLFPAATIMLSDALAFWLYSDLLTKSTYDPVLNVPTAKTFSEAVNYILDTVAALLATDIISNRDVGSDIAESVIDSFAQSVVGDAVKSYLDTVAGINPVDDDEIRDIVSEGAAATPEELAYLGARSGLDTFSAMAELYTGLLQGDNPYWSRTVKEIEDMFKRFERGLSADVYLAGALVEKLGGDVADSVYWYLEAVDGILNRLRTLAREVGEAYALYKRGVLDDTVLNEIYSNILTEVSAYSEILSVFSDWAFINALVDIVIESYTAFTKVVDLNAIYKKAEVLLDDVGKRMVEYAKTVKSAYEKLNSIRKIEVEKT
jgi:hypothetical protein